MDLATLFDRTLHNHPDLKNWIVLFNIVPTAIFLGVILVAAVINFGVAITIQVITVVISLIWFIPCLIFCSVGSVVAFFTYKRINQFLDKSRKVSFNPVVTTKEIAFEKSTLPTPPLSPVLEEKKEI